MYYLSYCNMLGVCTDERVTLDFGRTLQQARMAKTWTQKDLATVSTGLIVVTSLFSQQSTPLLLFPTPSAYQ